MMECWRRKDVEDAWSVERWGGGGGGLARGFRSPSTSGPDSLHHRTPAVGGVGGRLFIITESHRPSVGFSGELQTFRTYIRVYAAFLTRSRTFQRLNSVCGYSDGCSRSMLKGEAWSARYSEFTAVTYAVPPLGIDASPTTPWRPWTLTSRSVPMRTAVCYAYR